MKTEQIQTKQMSRQKMVTIKNVLTFSALSFFFMLFNSCQVIGGIFKAGVAVGIFIVVVVVGVIIYFITRSKN
jgi:hypothetical protein